MNKKKKKKRKKDATKSVWLLLLVSIDPKKTTTTTTQPLRNQRWFSIMCLVVNKQNNILYSWLIRVRHQANEDHRQTDSDFFTTVFI